MRAELATLLWQLLVFRSRDPLAGVSGSAPDGSAGQEEQQERAAKCDFHFSFLVLTGAPKAFGGGKPRERGAACPGMGPPEGGVPFRERRL